MADLIPSEVGNRFDCGIVSPSFGSKGFFLKPGSYIKEMQTQLRDEVVGAVVDSLVDRDIAFWKRISQTNWQKGRGELVFTDGERFRDSTSIDIHAQGQVTLVPAPTEEKNSGGVKMYGRGQCVALPAGGFPPTTFFPWIDGQFVYSQNAATGVPVIWATQGLLSALDHICWMDTDGRTAFMVMSISNGVFSTTAAAAGPAVPALYDDGAQAYAELVYDRLRKNIYAVTGLESHALASRLNKINAGGAATVIFDFVHGNLECIEMHLGNVVVAWNSGIMTQFVVGGQGGSSLKSTLYKYDGTNVTELVQMPDGVEVVGLKSYLGALYAAAVETDPYTGGVTGALYSVIGSTLSRIDSIDATLMLDAGTTGDPNGGSGIFIGSPFLMVGIGTHLLISVGNLAWVYDIVNGGLSRAFGVASTTGQIGGMIPLNGRIFTFHGGQVAGSITRLNGTPGVALVPTYSGEGTLTSARMDAGLPYVRKFWYGFEVVFKPLAVGDKIAFDYSLDDGVTFTACSNSPLTGTSSEKRRTFLVQQSNEHIIYRVTLTPATSDAGPTVVSIAAKYAVVNQNASVYRMTVDCYDKIRNRANAVEDGYGAEALTYLDNIARANETVTFYEPNDPDRTAHTCWVMREARHVVNTSGVYVPTLSEGEVDLVLWEVTNT